MKHVQNVVAINMQLRLVERTLRVRKNTSAFFTCASTRNIHDGKRCIGTKTDKTTIRQDEVEKFGQRSHQFWDAEGPFKALHCFNTHRVPFARDSLLDLKRVPLAARSGPRPLKGFKFVDVGCGAGLFSEPLARIGADVTGIDASPDLIRVAQEHASLDSSLSGNLRYLNTTVEEHSHEHSNQYDAVICSEVIEHVNNAQLFVENCVKLVKPSGSLIFTTFNKTWPSWFYMIFLAERVVNMIPKGTHHYELLVAPEHLEKMLISNGCAVRKVNGMLCLPNGTWIWFPSTTFSYALHAVKNKL